MRPRLVSQRFGSDAFWPRLFRVLAHTARTHCADTWDLELSIIEPRPLRSALGNLSHVANTQKMEAWFAAVERAPDGAGLLLMDADTMITRPLDDVWKLPFDFAYTTKPSRFPFNSGVVLVRATPALRAFMGVWRDENLRMLRDARHHQTWRKRYGGINQAALGHALENGGVRDLQVRELPCVEWNCEDSSWEAFDPAVTRIVHVKSRLRRAVLNLAPTPPGLRGLVSLWRDLERAALAAERAA